MAVRLILSSLLVLYVMTVMQANAVPLPDSSATTALPDQDQEEVIQDNNDGSSDDTPIDTQEPEADAEDPGADPQDPPEDPDMPPFNPEELSDLISNADEAFADPNRAIFDPVQSDGIAIQPVFEPPAEDTTNQDDDHIQIDITGDDSDDDGTSEIPLIDEDDPDDDRIQIDITGDDSGNDETSETPTTDEEPLEEEGEEPLEEEEEEPLEEEEEEPQEEEESVIPIQDASNDEGIDITVN